MNYIVILCLFITLKFQLSKKEKTPRDLAKNAHIPYFVNWSLVWTVFSHKIIYLFLAPPLTFDQISLKCPTQQDYRSDTAQVNEAWHSRWPSFSCAVATRFQISLGNLFSSKLFCIRTDPRIMQFRKKDAPIAKLATFCVWSGIPLALNWNVMDFQLKVFTHFAIYETVAISHIPNNIMGEKGFRCS